MLRVGDRGRGCPGLVVFGRDLSSPLDHCVLRAAAGDSGDEVVLAAARASGGTGGVGVAAGPVESDYGRLGVWTMSRPRGRGGCLNSTAAVTGCDVSGMM
jgi:hypothetical protein